MKYVYYPDYLYHHGVKGQKWGVRCYQNSNGTWTEEGKERRRRGKQKFKPSHELEKDYPEIYSRKKDGTLDYDHINEANDPDDEKDMIIYDSWERLTNDISDMSYDWYNSIPKSERMKQVYKDYNIEPPSNYRDVYENDLPSIEDLIGEEKMLGIVLNDLGYENTQDGRNFIRNFVMWD